MEMTRCACCGAFTWCRWTGPADTMPCMADPVSGKRPEATAFEEYERTIRLAKERT